MQEQEKFIYKGYILTDPFTNIPRYVGITKTSPEKRFASHMRQAITGNFVNSNKCNWILEIVSKGSLPILNTIYETTSEEEICNFEMNYIKNYKKLYNLTNILNGGQTTSDSAIIASHSRDVIINKSNTRPIIQYNIYGEKIAEYDITEDAARELNLSSASKITMCCKKNRLAAHGYIWRYKSDPYIDLSLLDPNNIQFNIICQYDLNNKFIQSFETYKAASEAIGDKSSGGNIKSVIEGSQKTCKGYIFKLQPNFIYFNSDLRDKIKYNPVSNLSKSKGTSILMCDIEKENIVKEFESISKAAQYINGNMSGRKIIKECCDGIRNEYKNYKWKYRSSINPSNSVDEP